jgi:hypothetical protein
MAAAKEEHKAGDDRDAELHGRRAWESRRRRILHGGLQAARERCQHGLSLLRVRTTQIKLHVRKQLLSEFPLKVGQLHRGVLHHLISQQNTEFDSVHA